MISLNLPWPPTGNHLRMPVRMRRGARLITSPEARQYKHDALISILQQLVAAQVKRPPNISERLDVRLVMHAPTKRVYDLDNRVKIVLDALVGAEVIADDSLIDSLGILRGSPTPGGSITVFVSTMLEIEAQHTPPESAR